MKMKKIRFNNPRQFFVLFILITLSRDGAGQNFYEGDLCDFDSYKGICMVASKCMDLPARMEKLHLESYNVGTCGYTVTEEIICCPNSPAPVQAPPAPLEDAIDMSSTTVPPTDFWNIFNENQVSLPASHGDRAGTESVNGLSNENNVKILNERLNQLWNIKPLSNEGANEKQQPTFNGNPLPPDSVNKIVEGIFSGVSDPKLEDENNAPVTEINFTPANEQSVSKDLMEDIITKRINEIFYNDNNSSENNKQFLINENRVSDAVIKDRLESILNAKRITNTNRNGASNNMPNKGKGVRINFDGIDGERPPPNNKSVRNRNGPPNGTRVLNTSKHITCETTHYKGTCTEISKCPHLSNNLKKLNLKESDVDFCAEEDTICCPKIERAADRACRALESKLMPDIAPHIIGGYKVGPTKFRHMAYIVYDIQGIFCGGSLIHKRFVLTAAHCIQGRSGEPSKVILGVANFNNKLEEEFRQVIVIKQTHVHEKYSSAIRYYDIGLLELEKDVTFSLTVYPTCLHTDTGLPDGTKLTVTGWGRTENQPRSDHLLAVELNHIPNSQCNQSYEGSIDKLRFDHGIDETQICASAPGKDSCVGDSGGPLHLVLDPAHNKYRVVGVVSFGLTCGSVAPGVYTRVTEFLDFIEKIVWPAETEM